MKLRRDERREQLLAVAWSILDAEGADSLTLGRLAERAGISKPVVYDHFPSRPALLVALYREFDVQQTQKLRRSLADAEFTLGAQAAAIAQSHVDCVVAHGRELSGVLGALEGSPDLEQLKRDAEAAYIELCRRALNPFAAMSTVPTASMIAIIGAAEALSQAAARRSLPSEEAVTGLTGIITAIVVQQGGN
ncbi:TetR/AcrR family transcriptional regulator [Nesterenkonia lutea]|uniref:AcrR family transcriptional regulator n=1 Tax=Nesterenkonia lutea TaxID=272919 RepID=A0ABR9JDG4_9MICC|nr:TetR/AcrR family transcriptional regulator [Nesterenkonia lutea]MBE1523967.1 AcrR family transcriptional regulator [Nesterenkonia lutea]